MSKRRTYTTLWRLIALTGAWLLVSSNWHCGKPSALCAERPDAECVSNQDCAAPTVCWMCECIECPTGRLPCGPGGVCIDTQENTLHCGGCNVVCTPDKPICKEGMCQSVPAFDKEVRVEAGSFTMGSPTDQIGRYKDETQRRVTITIPFYIWRTEVTQAEYTKYMKENTSQFSACGPDCPVESVTWNEAAAFANALSKAQGLAECYLCEVKTFVDEQTNDSQKHLICTLQDTYKDDKGNPAPNKCWGYRLPTEAEWEYAARAGTKTATYTGDLLDPACGPDRLLNKIAWYCNNATQTEPTATKDPNSWGLHDMLGNVREWVSDWYGAYAEDAQTDPAGPNSGSGRVVRGGCWDCRALENRCAYRFDHDSLRRESDLGFRVVRRAPAEK